jgi:hypothetical protein
MGDSGGAASSDLGPEHANDEYRLEPMISVGYAIL